MQLIVVLVFLHSGVSFQGEIPTSVAKNTPPACLQGTPIGQSQGACIFYKSKLSSCYLHTAWRARTPMSLFFCNRNARSCLVRNMWKGFLLRRILRIELVFFICVYVLMALSHAKPHLLLFASAQATQRGNPLSPSVLLLIVFYPFVFCVHCDIVLCEVTCALTHVPHYKTPPPTSRSLLANFPLASFTQNPF